MAALLLDAAAPSPPELPCAPLKPVSSSNDRFALERGLALMLVAVAAVYLRARDPLYNTAYMDESVYVVYGRMFLSHHFEAPLDTPLQWTFGWYLWPVMAALADRIGGLLALRELSAVLGSITVAATYGFASRVFSKTVGVASAAVMAVLAPAILVSRIATRDSGSICFFALGLWAYSAAWQTRKKRHWGLATVCFFAAFLCKYLVAIYFPVLVLLALWKGSRAFFLFITPLSAACGAYLYLHWADLAHLFRYGSGYGSLRADVFSVYITGRWDLAMVGWFALLAFAAPGWRSRVAWLWAGALILFAFQWETRADYDFWKHVNYAFLLLVPAAVVGVLFLLKELYTTNYLKRLQWGTTAILGLAIGAGLLGKVHAFDHFVFWPNVSPVLAYFEGRITSQDRLLVDDTVFRYYFNPPLHQPQIADPMYFHYHDSSGNDLFGQEAYKAAVSEKAFSYIVLDGGMGGEARSMNAAIRPVLDKYQLAMRAVDPVRGTNIEVYSREGAVESPGSIEAAVQAAPSIRLIAPASGATVNSSNAIAEGMVTGAQPGWSVRLEVFTNRWYLQGEVVPIGADGLFRQPILLSGKGRQQCYHLVRARLVDRTGNSRAVTLNHDIARSGEGGSCAVSADAG